MGPYEELSIYQARLIKALQEEPINCKLCERYLEQIRVCEEEMRELGLTVHPWYPPGL